MHIRDVTAADLGAIHAINEAGAPGVHPEAPEQLAAITRKACIALVANDGSLRFHSRKGFVEVGQLETDYGALVSLMAKRLRG